VPDRAPEVYKSIGLNYSSVIIDPAGRSPQGQTPRTTRRRSWWRRQAIKSDVQTGITQWLTKYGVEPEGASLANIRLSTPTTRRPSRPSRSRSRRPSRSATS